MTIKIMAFLVKRHDVSNEELIEHCTMRMTTSPLS
jgi:hypothetical protein